MHQTADQTDRAWFSRNTDRTLVSRKLDESIVNSLIEKHGSNFREMLSFEEINSLLLKMNYNPYPSKKSLNRPMRWMLKLDQ